MMHGSQPIHPFPARMASDIAFAEMQQLPKGSIVIDPMMGSGTVVRVAAQQGHQGIGRDVAPLAVLMARVWTTPIDTKSLLDAGTALVDEAQQLDATLITLPWIDDDQETQSFIDYWFDTPQQHALRCLSFCLAPRRSAEADALRVVLSKLIITKDHGASLARDVSHSRPHHIIDLQKSHFGINSSSAWAATEFRSILKQSEACNDRTNGDAQYS